MTPDLQSPDAASVALIEAGRVLLIQRAHAPYRLLWTLPGGRVDPGESAADCAEREVHEELGLRVSGLRHLETQSLVSASGTWRLAVFVAGRFEGAIRPSDEVADLRWVPLDEVPAMRTTSRLHDLLRRAFVLAGAR